MLTHFLSFLLSILSVFTTHPVLAATTSSLSVGVVVDDYANRTGAITNLESLTNRTFSTISIFKQFGNSNNYLNFDDLTYIKSSGKKLLIAWEPWNPAEGLRQSRNYLAQITSGALDPYLIQFAHQIKTYAAPVTIRFGHEANGDWYPWGRKPKDYISAYRHIVNLFRGQSVTNVTWMWSVNASPVSNLSRYYPGSAYVNVIGVDGFNFGATQSWSTWTSFSDIFSPAIAYLTLRYSQPIVISETASAEIGGSKAAWITGMFSTLQTKFPNIHEIVWFDLNKETDWRIDSSPQSLAAFKLD